MKNNKPIIFDSKFPWLERPSMEDFINGRTGKKALTPVKVETQAELEDAVKQQAETIIIEGGLATDITRIKTTGKLSWVVAIGTLCLNVFKAYLEYKAGTQPSFTGNAKGNYYVRNADSSRIELNRI